jgi:hypothetical protein
MTVRFVNVCTDVSQPLAFVHHFHHVTRDAYTNFSANAHGVKFWLIGWGIVLYIAGSIARVAVVHAAAVTRNVPQGFAVEHSETISISDFGRSIPETIGKHRDRRELIDVIPCPERSARQPNRSRHNQSKMKSRRFISGPRVRSLTGSSKNDNTVPVLCESYQQDSSDHQQRRGKRGADSCWFFRLLSVWLVFTRLPIK